MDISRVLSPLLLIALFLCGNCLQGEFCTKGEDKDIRYLLYDVNPGEGFNLRRDVYVRVANLARRLAQNDNWVLVLPPWGGFYHWFNTPTTRYFPWRSFFDVNSLQKWIQVIEFEDFLKANGAKVDAAYVLQHYEEGWSDGKWEEKYDERPCLDKPPFKHQEGDEVWLGYMWGAQVTSPSFSCISVQGHTSTIIPLLTNDSSSRSLFIGRAETVLHDEFGGKWYWRARRSMRFAGHLQEEAGKFRAAYLSSDDAKDDTQLPPDWRDAKPQRRRQRGGPYLGVHLRRNDFVRARGNQVPSLKRAAQQINVILQKENLTSVFIATDAPHTEFLELRSHIPSGVGVHQYLPEGAFEERWGDGGVAIVDQIICSHARYFVGSYESTFSFRIQEEREILGFAEETTFNRLCGSNSKCEQPAKWRISY